MHQYQSIRMQNIVLTLLVSLGLSSCVAYDQPYGPGYTHTPPPPNVVFYSYWYYPDIQVYFDYNRQVYFYFSNNHWVQTRVLPPSLRAHMGGYVPIQSRYNQPYIEHNEHRRKYPSHYRDEHRPPQRHDDYNVPTPHNDNRTPYKQPPQAGTNDSHSKSSYKDKVKDKDKDKQTKQTKDTKNKHDKDKPNEPVKKKDEQGDRDKDQRDSR